MKHARVATVIGAVAVAGLVAGACDVDDTAYTGNGAKTIAVIGDNVSDNSVAAIHTALDPVGKTRIVAHDSGTGTSMSTAAATLAGTNPDVVVIELGTFDAADPSTSSNAAIANIEALYAQFPTACKVFVTVNQGAQLSGFDASKAAAINAYMTDKYFNADWNSSISGQVSTMTQSPDAVVPTAAGLPVLGQSFADGVGPCVVGVS